jgi:phage terminase large subunit-like protein
MSDAANLRAFERHLDDLLKQKAMNRIMDYRPYAKQKLFHEMGAVKIERLLSAGNQLGKTFTGAHEMAYHLTGRYPAWWKGRKWSKAIRAWVGGESGEVIRDTSQKQLFGDVSANRDNLGTGIIPADCITNVEWSRGIANAIDTATIKHASGGSSTLKFKSYEMGRQKWQGDTVDIVWFDEEPPADIYSEGFARRTATKGMVYLTFTPLKGMSTVVKRFKLEANDLRGEVIMTYRDAGHIDEQALAQMMSGYPVHEHACRINGVPMQGEGRIFTVAESVISEKPFDLPEHWPRIIGADFGHGNHPTAAAWLAWDRDLDVVHLYRSYRAAGLSIAENAAAMRAAGRIPVAWPPDLNAVDRFSGTAVKTHYQNNFLLMLPSAAVNPDGSNHVWPGIVELQQRMEQGRFKVFSTEDVFFEEYRNYHLDDGKIVKKDDDLIDAVRYGTMSLKYARIVDKSWYPGRNTSVATVAQGMDFNPLR